jgi:hypothetical protein
MYNAAEFLRVGKLVEHACAQLAAARGYTVRAATPRQDIHEHWDLAMRRAGAAGADELRVEVKGLKAPQRGAAKQDQWHWIELRGVKDAGWLYGGLAHLVAFETLDAFVLVNRERLIDLVEALVPPTSPHVGVALGAKYRLYTRERRNDLLTLIETQHLRDAAWEIWPKE